MSLNRSAQRLQGLRVHWHQPQTIDSCYPYTAGSTIAGCLQHVICAINESRGVGIQVGFAFVNLSTGVCTLSEVCDSQTYLKTINKLGVFDLRGGEFGVNYRFQ